MTTIRIDLPESVLVATGQSEEDFVREAKLAVALYFFERGRISSGCAAEICDLPRIDFLYVAGRSGVPVADLGPAELDREFA